MDTFMAALGELSAGEPVLFGERMEEFAYLANVLLAGHERNGARLRLKSAADAVLATVGYGAVVELRSGCGKGWQREKLAPSDFVEVLRTRSVDLLFRVASHALATGAASKGTRRTGLLYSAEELDAAID